MKLLVSFGIFMFAMSFCGLGEKLSKLGGGGNSSNSPTTTSSPGTTGSPTSSGDTVEKPALTSQQQSIMDSGENVSWDGQGISWTLPKGWKKMSSTKESFNYSSPDNAFLLANISVMPDNFPSEASVKATYESSLQQLKNGKYLSARYLEIDGIKGVEWIEAPPEGKDDPRRQQWIGFRNYQGQNQQLNIMTSTKGSNFDRHKDDFPAILYSMKIGK